MYSKLEVSLKIEERWLATMNWEDLFKMQKGLDEYISKNHDLVHEELFDEVVLALLVELGELANETRCFKFWSNKARSESGIVLEEYVDNIHFLLSLGLSKGYEFSTITTKETDLTETEQFLLVFDNCLKFYRETTKENYLALFQAYLQLAVLLGFSEAAIQTAYHEKNKVNYERQQSGY